MISAEITRGLRGQTLAAQESYPADLGTPLVTSRRRDPGDQPKGDRITHSAIPDIEGVCGFRLVEVVNQTTGQGLAGLSRHGARDRPPRREVAVGRAGRAFAEFNMVEDLPRDRYSAEARVEDVNPTMILPRLSGATDLQLSAVVQSHHRAAL